MILDLYNEYLSGNSKKILSPPMGYEKRLVSTEDLHPLVTHINLHSDFSFDEVLFFKLLDKKKQVQIEHTSTLESLIKDFIKKSPELHPVSYENWNKIISSQEVLLGIFKDYTYKDMLNFHNFIKKNKKTFSQDFYQKNKKTIPLKIEILDCLIYRYQLLSDLKKDFKITNFKEDLIKYLCQSLEYPESKKIIQNTITKNFFLLNCK